MQYKIIFSESSKEDLIGIVKYISIDLETPVIARKIADKILNEIKSLNQFPKRYKLCEFNIWKNLGLRVFPVDNYLVFYIVDDSFEVKIYRVLYGKRDIQKEIT